MRTTEKKPKQPPKCGFTQKERRKLNFNRRKMGGMHGTSEEIEIGGCDINQFDELLHILEDDTMVLHN